MFRFLHRRAQAEFTDREEPFVAFWDAVAKANRGEPRDELPTRVLQYYGVGGIGKTRLIAELESAYRAQQPKSLIAKVDFDDASVLDPPRALLRLRRTASGEQSKRFGTFDFAFAAYFAKRNPDFSFKRTPTFLEEARVVAGVIDAVEGMGWASAITDLVTHAQMYASRLRLEPVARKALQALATMTERDIAEALPDFLAYDVNRVSAATGRVPVLFLDTYEALWSDNVSEKDRYAKDAWVRRLVKGLDRGVVVIAGREKLRWVDYDTSWTAHLSTHLLERLAEPDVRRFLASVDITDDALVRRIADVSEGHPYYLDLCLDMIEQDGNLEARRWPETRRELFERFARSLSTQELSLLLRLAPLSRFDEAYVKAAVRHFNIGLNDDEVRASTRFSFVKLHEDGATLHAIMRRNLLEHTAADLVAEIRDFALGHYEERLGALGTDCADSELVNAFRECVVQLKHMGDAQRLSSWLQGAGAHAIHLLQQRAATGPILESLDALRSVSEASVWPIEIQTAYADMTHLVGSYGASIEMLERLGGTLESLATADPDRAFAFVRRVHHSMMVLPLDRVWSEAAACIEELDPVRLAAAYDEAVFLLGGNLGATRGVPDDAWPWLLHALRRSWRRNDTLLRIRVYRKASDLYRLRGDLTRSRRVLERALPIARGLQVRRYVHYLECTMVDQLRLEGAHEAARDLLREVQVRIASDEMEGWLGHTHLEAAAVAIGLGDERSAADALVRAQAAYDRTHHLWGTCQVASMRLRLRTIAAQSIDAERLDAHRQRLLECGYVRDARCLSFRSVADAWHVPAITFI